MRAPKCRTCGVEHWGSVCAQSEPATKTRAVAARPAEKAGAASNPEYKHTRVAISTKFTDAYKEPILVDPVLTEGVALTVRGTPRKRAPKGTFDRKAYQREAARLRRQRQKEGKQ